MTRSLFALLLILVVPTTAWAQSSTGRFGPRPFPIEVATAVAVCMGESEAAGGAFGVSGGVDDAQITAGGQPIVWVTRDEINPDLTPWFVKRPTDSMALVILHAGPRTHLAVQRCYDQMFPA